MTHGDGKFDKRFDDDVRRCSLDEMLLAMAEAASTRSTCSRLHVGAVLARHGRPFAAGYNGAPSGLPHCLHADGSPCQTSVHAEVNAVANAARHGAATEGSTLYVTHAPCQGCAGVLVNAGIVAVIYGRAYRTPAGLELLGTAGVVCNTL